MIELSEDRALLTGVPSDRLGTSQEEEKKEKSVAAKQSPSP
ncbi:hypothetical protein [Rivularia sp. UHCC 0363]|nr:hypothetical protein [Rivularia sp. UHCC 0363]MEA5593877.1 hypothetical protein [Rivularia sp. UHCC 0363]